MMPRILLNVLRCSGFMKKSLSMFVVGQKDTLTSPFLILSVTKKYHTFMWHVLFELEDLPFSASSIVLLLSWYTVIVGMGYPCAAKKCLVHSTCPNASSTATSSASVEPLVFNFCLHEAMYVAPFPSVIYIPV